MAKGDSGNDKHCSNPGCTVTYALKLIDGKWKLPIICTLGEQTVRYNELKRQIKGITSMMLTSSLKELEECGIVHRKAYNEVPPKVEYSLTKEGMSLTPILFNLGLWGQDLKCNERSE
ncbi:hypothetical protein AKG39_19175 [Acetobacterium bakii]|uniref:HTH hxlR-type domain-containing protein n=1 Tax=Acetobacterium bakii TaxID=52689 RepID=A0A0L6TVQ1_9FIRM|nr:hypothetical protein AKG39_19175 [Acetobacterium bakii]